MSPDKQALDFEREILLPNKISISTDAMERIWHILTNTEWISPVAGFGKANKNLCHTHQGIN